MRSALAVLVGFCFGFLTDSRVAADNPCYIGTATIQGLEATINQPGLSATALASLRHRRGRLLAERGAYELALEDFAAALQHRSNMAEAYADRGTLLAHLGSRDQAMKAFDQALQLRPDNATTLIQRGELAYEQGKIASAIDNFNAALEIDPKSTNAFVGRANARRDQAWRSGHRHRQALYQQVLNDYARAIKLEPSNAKAYFHRAMTYHRLDQFDQEAVDWAMAIELDPNLFWQYGIIYRHRHLYEELRSDPRS